VELSRNAVFCSFLYCSIILNYAFRFSAKVEEGRVEGTELKTDKVMS
jgi:hypothetical protein